MLYGWEIEFDLNPLKNDSMEDPDNDGFTNFEEFENGTNPHIFDEPTPTQTTETTIEIQTITIDGYLFAICLASIIFIAIFSRNKYNL